MVNLTQQYAYYIGIIGLLFTPLMIIVAFLLEPSYNPYLQTISKLGVTNNGQYAFILGTVVGGLSLVIFHYFYFNDVAKNDKEIQKTLILGTISGIGLMGVGAIQDKSEMFFRTFHWLFAFIFFLFTGLFVYYFCLHVKSKEPTRKYYYLVKSGLFPIIMILSYVFFSLFNDKMVFLAITFKIHIIWQKLTVFSIIVWYLILFYYAQKTDILIFLQYKDNLTS